MPKHKSKKKSRGEVYTKEEPVNRFQNDGSFMDMFKKMAEQTQQAQLVYQQQYGQYGQHYPSSDSKGETSTASYNETGNEEQSDQPYTAPQAVTYKSGAGEEIRSQQGLVGKRKSLMKSIELREKRKKRLEQKEEQQSTEQEGQKSSAWKSYMAEVKAYEAMKCGDTDEHKRPLVK